jgi:hypothetical protein
LLNLPSCQPEILSSAFTRRAVHIVAGSWRKMEKRDILCRLITKDFLNARGDIVSAETRRRNDVVEKASSLVTEHGMTLSWTNQTGPNHHEDHRHTQ